MKIYQVIFSIIGGFLVIFGISWFILWMSASQKVLLRGLSRPFVRSFTASVSLMILGIFLSILIWRHEIKSFLSKEI